MPADDRAQSPPVLLRRADQVLSHAEDGLNLIAALAIFFLMFVGVVQIVGRTVFDFAIYGYIDWIEQASVLFAFLGIAYAQRLGSHIGMDLTMGWRPATRWKIELFGVAMALAIITVLIYASFTNFLRAYSIGDSTMDIRLPTWPAKLMVPLALSVLWLRLSLQIWGYLRMIANPDAEPIGIPRLVTIETQVQDEIAEVLGKQDAR
ncbi:TRAP transporter small permease subunit [Reyranella sp.]|uniref:TRAP transporter small permease subunit n=1 Tax=Reyranella sp. TaxID=1929291 RepID=UPI002731ADEC|nr:TRAP transporter small permease [Reyranella sp.]MDP2372791.1 TRAP transporter small permease [Reyranella sp.]